MNPPLWLDNVVAYGIQIAIVVGLGTALPVAFRLRSPGIMLPYWQGLLFACVVLPLVQPWNQTPTALPGAPSIGVVSVQNIVSAARHHNASGWIYSGIQLVLMGGVLVRLGWLGIGMCRLRRYRREARVLQILPDAVTRMQSITGVRAEVRISGEIDSPGAFGFFRPVILLPGGFLQMNDRSQRAIACHELLHVRRRDWLCIFLEKVVGALLWFHPAVWWLLGRIELSREQVIDREVVQITGSPKAYLEALLKIAQHKGQPEVTLAPSFLNRHHLAKRVAMIVTEVSMSRALSIALLSVTGGLLLAAGGIATWAFPLQKTRRSSGRGYQTGKAEAGDAAHCGRVSTPTARCCAGRGCQTGKTQERGASHWGRRQAAENRFRIQASLPGRCQTEGGRRTRPHGTHPE